MNPEWRYAGIEYDDVVNGSGLGAVFFTQGCPHHCKHCHNPQSWPADGGKEFSQSVIDGLLKYYQSVPYATRLTISGGDPMASPGITKHVISQFKKKYPGKPVWLYTGYCFEDIITEHRDIVELCDVIVDGRFEIDKRDVTLQFRGSSNQRLIDVQQSLKTRSIVTLK